VCVCVCVCVCGGGGGSEYPHNTLDGGVVHSVKWYCLTNSFQ
jgi:hypothetical protein